MKLAKIEEIFKSYQGEGLWQGKEQVFVRFFGCNLNCSFCDTKQDSYRLMQVNQVIEKIYSFGSFHSVSLTGGEPLMQVDFIADLIRALKDLGEIIYLETNGVLYKKLARIIDSVDMISMDFKFPSSSGQPPFWAMHRNFIKVAKRADLFIKAVIGRDTTFTDLEEAIAVIKKSKPNLSLVLQPENPYEKILEKKLIDFKKKCTDSSISVKIVPQLHKKLGIK
ncbi:MAG: 7-carboxy-7-deazaguanine synthase QueE [Candidatus Omnitrophica bacterium]|nr:7-carboxy-7-deazaguanine synthase QueE [Candidatus Omnitrophota bacterium]MCF7893907.1 7-carboxy-7-deazaguanine synthase QueE [Candidatus Omnitrophota bacterium]